MLDNFAEISKIWFLSFDHVLQFLSFSLKNFGKKVLSGTNVNLLVCRLTWPAGIFGNYKTALRLMKKHMIEIDFRLEVNLIIYFQSILFSVDVIQSQRLSILSLCCTGLGLGLHQKGAWTIRTEPFKS